MTSAPRKPPTDRAFRRESRLASEESVKDVATRAPATVIVGNFDGVHLGHQAVLAEASNMARARGLVTTVLTFDPHPALVLRGSEPPRLTTTPRKARLLLDHADRVCVQTFDIAYSQTSPERFAVDLLVSALDAKLVVVGEDFRFGHKRAGDIALMRALGAQHGFEVVAHALAGDASGRFSSSRGRDAAAAGDTERARAVLGRPHSISGVVAKGDQRGRTIGFPTANVEGVLEVLPARGVYAVRVDAIRSREDALVEETQPLGVGVMNHGVRPTVDGHRQTVEVHLFDFAGDLYGQRLRVHLERKLRDEQKFSGLDELKAQIARDAEAAREILALVTPQV